MDRDGNVVDEHFVPALQDQLDSERTARASAETGREMAQRKLRSAASAMGWIGGICALASVLTLVGSFFLPILPRAAAGWCLAGALLGWGVQYFLLVYGVYFAEAAVWLSVAACVVMGITVGIRAAMGGAVAGKGCCFGANVLALGARCSNGRAMFGGWHGHCTVCLVRCFSRNNFFVLRYGDEFFFFAVDDQSDVFLLRCCALDG